MKVAIITSGKSFARKFCTKEETQNVWKAWHFFTAFLREINSRGKLGVKHRIRMSYFEFYWLLSIDLVISFPPQIIALIRQNQNSKRMSFTLLEIAMN